jgi:hypothetical protein
MASNNIDSFVKIKALCQAGSSASLNFSSNAGKVSVILCLDLRVLEEGPHLPSPFQKLTCIATSQGETSSRHENCAFGEPEAQFWILSGSSITVISNWSYKGQKFKERMICLLIVNFEDISAFGKPPNKLGDNSVMNVGNYQK